MGKIIPIPGKPIQPSPPELTEKVVQRVYRDGAGYYVEFPCGHRVWFAHFVLKGERYFCSICVDQLVRRLRAAKSNEAR